MLNEMVDCIFHAGSLSRQPTSGNKSERTWMVLLPSFPLANPAALGRKPKCACSSKQIQGCDGQLLSSARLVVFNKISYCCLSAFSVIKFLVKPCCLCFSLDFEDVLVLSLLPSDY